MVFALDVDVEVQVQPVKVVAREVLPRKAEQLRERDVIAHPDFPTVPSFVVWVCCPKDQCSLLPLLFEYLFDVPVRKLGFVAVFPAVI